MVDFIFSIFQLLFKFLLLFLLALSTPLFVPVFVRDLPDVVEFTLVHQIRLVNIIQAISFLLAGVIFNFGKHLLIVNVQRDESFQIVTWQRPHQTFSFNSETEI